MDNVKRNEIVLAMMDILQKAPDGYCNTTARLVEEAGYSLGEFENMEIHYALLEEADKVGLTLDFSEYDDADVGMPFVLTFVLRK